MIEHKKNKLDLIGMSASLVCAVHCAMIPVFFSFGSAYLAELLHHPVFEVGFLVVAIIVAVWSLGTSYLFHHHNRIPLFIGILGVALITLGVAMHAWYITLPGGIVLAIAHLRNFRMLKACHCGLESI